MTPTLFIAGSVIDWYMDEQRLLEKVKKRGVSAQEFRERLIRCLEAGTKQGKKTKDETARLAKLLEQMPDDRLFSSAELLLEEFASINARGKEGRAKLAGAVKKSMSRMIMQHAAKYANKRTPAVSYVPGVGSERLEEKLKRSKTESSARETLHELLDLILESSKASFETLKEELVKEIRKEANKVYIGAPEKNDPIKRVEAAVEKKIGYYSDAEGKAGEDIPVGVGQELIARFANGNPAMFMLLMYYPEIAEAFAKYPKLSDDKKVKEYAAKIVEAFMRMQTLPEEVAKELLKPPTLGEFLKYKLEQL